MPQLSHNIGAISKGAMAMMYIMLSYLCNIFIVYETLSENVYNILRVWNSVMHSSLYCTHMSRNITPRSYNYLYTMDNVAKIHLKCKLRNLLVIYLEVITMVAFVTYCSIVESGRLIDEIKSLLVIQSVVMVLLTIIIYSSITQSGRLLWTNHQQSEILSEFVIHTHKTSNVYLSVAEIAYIVTLRSIISAGKLIEHVKSLISVLLSWYLVICLTIVANSNSVTSLGKLNEFIRLIT